MSASCLYDDALFIRFTGEVTYLHLSQLWTSFKLINQPINPFSVLIHFEGDRVYKKNRNLLCQTTINHLPLHFSTSSEPFHLFHYPHHSPESQSWAYLAKLKGIIKFQASQRRKRTRVVLQTFTIQLNAYKQAIHQGWVKGVVADINTILEGITEVTVRRRSERSRTPRASY